MEASWKLQSSEQPSASALLLRLTLRPAGRLAGGWRRGAALARRCPKNLFRGVSLGACDESWCQFQSPRVCC